MHGRTTQQAAALSQKAGAFGRCGIAPVICLGPGGDFRTEFVPGEHPGTLDILETDSLELEHLGSDNLEVDAQAAGEVVGLTGMARDVAHRVAEGVAQSVGGGWARLVGILSTADGMLERQQMALFRLRHLATTSANALEQSVPRAGGRMKGVSKSGAMERVAPRGSKGSVDSLTGLVVGLAESNGTDEGWHVADDSRRVGQVEQRSEQNTGTFAGVTAGGGGGGIGGTGGIGERGQWANRAVPLAHVAQDEKRIAPTGAWRRNHEPDTKATEDSATDPRLAGASGLFADDAGAGRRDRREQGDGLRTRRSAHQKERARARAQQGTLFVDC